MHLFFLFFLISGFCSLVYEIVWLRLAMAQFGVNTPLVSLVLSIFMAGLGLGSWAAGRLSLRLRDRNASTMLSLYAVAELLIGASAIVVPLELTAGRRLLTEIGSGLQLGSLGYYVAAGVLLSLALLPWCTCMGATFPLAMAALRKSFGEKSARSFSFLYVANVLGAVLGTLVPAFVLIELLGFRQTLYVAMAMNILLAAAAFLLSRRAVFLQALDTEPQRGDSQTRGSAGDRSLLWMLLATGLAGMAMEVVWFRQFTPYLGTEVYAFAAVLGAYLATMLLGSQFYRVWVRKHDPDRSDHVWYLAGVLTLLPLAAADYRWGVTGGALAGLARVLIGIGPICAVFGFLTPMLVDRCSGGDPDRAGKAYAVNIIGCLIGPLVAGFVLLPLLGNRWSLCLLSLPLFGIWVTLKSRGGGRVLPPSLKAELDLRYVLPGIAALGLLFVPKAYEDRFTSKIVRRDSTATVVATGKGMNRRMLINGVGTTSLTPITKIMAHLPMAARGKKPESSLVICFGMGTSFRALHSWGAPVTAVELVPSVPELFDYYYEDAHRIVASPNARIVIDDGRRFLERTPDRFDVITIDPPPPVEAAGSSLLYSCEFYALVRQRLSAEGILQQWCPSGEDRIRAAIAQSLADSFPHVRVFRSIEGWGLHFLASESELPFGSDPRAASSQLAARMPPEAVRDLLEWGPASSAQEQFLQVLSKEVDLKALLDKVDAPPIHDDRPFNEYFFLRRLMKGNAK